MNLQEHQNQQDREYRKRLRIVIVTVVLTVVFFPLLVRTFELANNDRDMIDSAQQLLDATKPVDSVPMAKGKVTRDRFETDFSAESWFGNYSSNKIAFDKEYDKSTFDVYGQIEEISEEWGCSKIVLKVEDNSVKSISCNNCYNMKDKWASQVEKTAVGNYVHIRGTYDASMSGKYTMYLLACDIIE